MRDPHVVALHYRLVTNENITFSNPPPVEHETENFHIRLVEGNVIFRMKQHHASEQAARACAEPHLRAWELDAALRLDPGRIAFIFERSEIIDRNPPGPDESQIITPIATELVTVSNAGTTQSTQSLYPEPPKGLMVSPDVETMWMRYEAYKANRETLAAMGYMCLTVLEASAGGRKNAAKQYGISSNVLDTLARLTTEVGDQRTARKMLAHHNPRPHTPVEKNWIEAAVKKLIRRAGECAFDASATVPQITMTDLPHL